VPDKINFSEEYWEKHYQKAASQTEGSVVGPYIRSELSHLAPGLALDAGCGVGLDAIWLARQGWQVTAVDVSEVALSRARISAEAAGIAINFDQVNLTTWSPSECYFDLVTSHYVHTSDDRSFIYKIGSAVKSGGTLLIVGHEPPLAGKDDHYAPGSHITVEKVASFLDINEWEIEIIGARKVKRSNPQHHSHLSTDSVFKARKK